MNQDDQGMDELRELESRLQDAVLGGPAPLADAANNRILSRVRSHVRSNPHGSSRGWSGRFLIFAAIAAPAAAAAALALAIISSQPQKAVVPAPATSPRAVPSPVASPVQSAEQLLVMLQDSKQSQRPIELGSVADTIVLVSREGRVRNRATFTPTPIPLFTNAAAILPPQAHAAAGSAYYVDGASVVWRLGPSGSPEEAADFGVPGDQHETAFAVSPDGRHLFASVLTFGKPRTCATICSPFTSGPSYDVVMSADAGGPARLVTKTQIDPNQPGARITVVLGWDGAGPLAAMDTPLATQNQSPSGWNAHVGHINDQGQIVDSMGGPDCTAQQQAASGAVLCAVTGFEATNDVVRTVAGAELWSLPPKLEPRQGMAISPDGNAVAYLGYRLSGTPPAPNYIYKRQGDPLKLAGDLDPVDWLDNSTVIGYAGDLNQPTLETVDVNAPGHTLPFAVNGFYADLINR
jgi:hypothetical protein